MTFKQQFNTQLQKRLIFYFYFFLQAKLKNNKMTTLYYNRRIFLSATKKCQRLVVKLWQVFANREINLHKVLF
jgi:hypothetical protein